MAEVNGTESGLPNIIDTETKKNEPLPLISGKDRGFIRSNPEKMKDLLRTSFSTGDITDGLGEHTNAILGRITDLTTKFGQIEIKSGLSAGKAVEKFHSSTAISSLGSFRDLTIKIEGFVDPADLSENDPRPIINIKFSRRLDTGMEHFRFDIGRNNKTLFNRTFKDDDEPNQNITKLTQEEASSFLLESLPEIEEIDGHPRLSAGHVLIAGEGNNIRRFLDGVRYGRQVGTNMPMVEERNRAKIEKYGQESVLYLPQEYFTAGSRDTLFFSYDYPQSVIPEDILEHPQMEDRIRMIAKELGINADEKVIENMQTILEGLPAGSSRIGFLVKQDDGSVIPNIGERVPTMIFDKTVKYLLVHPELLNDPIEKYHKMSEEIGRKPADESAIDRGITAGLVEGYDGRKIFGELSEAFFTNKDMKSSSVQDAIDNAYDSLVQFGKVLRDEVYSPDEIALVAQDM